MGSPNGKRTPKLKRSREEEPFETITTPVPSTPSQETIVLSQTPLSKKKRRFAQMRQLTGDEALYIAKFIEKRGLNATKKNQMTLNDSEGKPEISLIHFDFDSQAPFRLLYDGLPYIPADDKGDLVLQRECIQIVKKKGLDIGVEKDLQNLKMALVLSFWVAGNDLETRIQHVLSEDASPLLHDGVHQQQVWTFDQSQRIKELEQKVSEGIKQNSERIDYVEQNSKQNSERIDYVEQNSFKEIKQNSERVDRLENSVAQLKSLKQSVAQLQNRYTGANPFFFYSQCSRLINEQLRKGMLEPNAQDWLLGITTMLDTLPVFQGFVYRGIDLAGFSREEIHSQFCTIGSIYCDGALTSTSSKEEVARHFVTLEEPGHGVIMMIQHFSGRCIQEFVANEYKWEHEILFKPRTKFQVVNFERLGAHNYKAWLREIP